MAYQGKYESPADVLRDEGLSHQEKVEMLEKWRDDKNAYMRASEEGMQGDDKSELLRQIKKALLSLEESPQG